MCRCVVEDCSKRPHQPHSVRFPSRSLVLGTTKSPRVAERRAERLGPIHCRGLYFVLCNFFQCTTFPLHHNRCRIARTTFVRGLATRNRLAVEQQDAWSMLQNGIDLGDVIVLKD